MKKRQGEEEGKREGVRGRKERRGKKRQRNKERGEKEARKEERGKKEASSTLDAEFLPRMVITILNGTAFSRVGSLRSLLCI